MKYGKEILRGRMPYYYYDNLSLVEIRKKVFGYNGMGELIDAAYEMLCWCIKEGHVTKN